MLLRTRPAVLLATAAATIAACGGNGKGTHRATTPGVKTAAPSVPPLLNPSNVYAADAAGNFSPTVRADPPLIYVPNSLSNTVDVINPRTYKVVRHLHFRVKRRPQHVVPSYDLKTLYVASDLGNSLQPIDPTTARPSGPPIPVADPYNLYSRPTANTRSRSPSCSSDSIFAIHTPCNCAIRCRCRAVRASTTPTSPPTGATCTQAASTSAP
jgi:YVTN family beta-propeller protein